MQSTKISTGKMLTLCVVALSLFVGVFFLTKNILWDFVVFVQSAGTSGQVLFGLVYVLATIVVMPGLALALSAGFVYGWLGGLMIIVPASILGGSGAFLAARYLARDRAHKFIEKIPHFEAIDRAIERVGFGMILLLFAYPLTPFRILNYGLALTRVSFGRFFVALALSMIPHMLPYVYLGSLVSDIKQIIDGSFYDFLAQKPSLYLPGLAVTLVFSILLTFWLRKMIKNVIWFEKHPES